MSTAWKKTITKQYCYACETFTFSNSNVLIPMAYCIPIPVRIPRNPWDPGLSHSHAHLYSTALLVKIRAARHVKRFEFRVRSSIRLTADVINFSASSVSCY